MAGFVRGGVLHENYTIVQIILHIFFHTNYSLFTLFFTWFCTHIDQKLHKFHTHFTRLLHERWSLWLQFLKNVVALAELFLKRVVAMAAIPKKKVVAMAEIPKNCACYG